jgi:hypothetical protein
LTIVVRVTAEAAVADCQVKETVRTEADLSAVMVPVGAGKFQEDAFGFQIDAIIYSLELANDGAFWVLLAVKNVTQLVRFKLRMKRKAKQAFLVIHERLAIDDIEEFFRIGTVLTTFDSHNSPLLFDNEKSR